MHGFQRSGFLYYSFVNSDFFLSLIIANIYLFSCWRDGQQILRNLYKLY